MLLVRITKKMIFNFEDLFIHFIYFLDIFNVFGYIINGVAGYFCRTRNIAWHQNERERERKREIDRE